VQTQLKQDLEKEDTINYLLLQLIKCVAKDPISFVNIGELTHNHVKESRVGYSELIDEGRHIRSSEWWRSRKQNFSLYKRDFQDSFVDMVVVDAHFPIGDVTRLLDS
jgi:hypothetical protein